MEHEATTETQDTELLENAFKSLDVHKAQIDKSEQAYETELLALADRFSKTFCVQGQWYQVIVREIKEKGRSVPILKRLSGHPRTWLRGRPRVSKPTEVAVSTTAETAVVLE
jgi:hypothetical protein